MNQLKRNNFKKDELNTWTCSRFSLFDHFDVDYVFNAQEIISGKAGDFRVEKLPSLVEIIHSIIVHFPNSHSFFKEYKSEILEIFNNDDQLLKLIDSDCDNKTFNARITFLFINKLDQDKIRGEFKKLMLEKW